MCGIAGFVGEWPASLARAMAASIAHRGPDGEGHWYERGIALSHRRLSIIDLSEAAAQPMHSKSKRYVITFNGEIFNFKELRRELQQAHVSLRTESDTEVLLELFDREGVNCISRLNGIFAFAIWDREKKKLFLARDHLGVKPLYYASLPKGLLFASELKALILCADLPRGIDFRTVGDHVACLWTAGQNTMLRSVQKLRPGRILCVSADGQMSEQVYYKTPLYDNAVDASPKDPADLLNKIDEIVADQIVADVEVGAMLSGGLDSSTIVSSMCKVMEPSKIKSFCASVGKSNSYKDNFGDDHGYAKLVSKRLGVDLIEVPTDSDLVYSLPNMVWQLDEPTADFAAIQTYLIARAARDNGIKVLLSGVGGDDLFTGYPRHTAGLIWFFADRMPALRRISGLFLKNFPPNTILTRRLNRLGSLLSSSEDEMLAKSMSYSAVSEGRLLSLFSSDVRAFFPSDGIPEAIRILLEETRGRHPVERLLDLELNGFLPDHNLNYSDKMAMNCGVEVRVPLVDHRLVEYATQLPLETKLSLHKTKKILRTSQVGRLPKQILTRSKQGFGVPLRSWLQGPARDFLEELTAPEVLKNRGFFSVKAVEDLKDGFFKERLDSAFSLFPMMAIELWCRKLEEVCGDFK